MYDLRVLPDMDLLSEREGLRRDFSHEGPVRIENFRQTI